MADPRVRPLTIFLIKEGLGKDQIIKKLSTHRHRFFRIGDQRYDVYAKRLEPDLPDWWSFFEDRLPDDIVGTSDLPGGSKDRREQQI
jgi:hypothetical protein